MNVSELLSASSRRLLVAVSLAALVCSGSSVLAQDPAAAPKQEPPDLLKLTNDYVLIMNQIKADKAADFEASWDKIHAGLAKSTKDDLKQLGESIKIFKIDVPPADVPGGTGKAVTYIFQLFPPVKTQSYQPTKILFESGAFERPEAQAIFDQLKDCYLSINPIPLTKIGG